MRLTRQFEQAKIKFRYLRRKFIPVLWLSDLADKIQDTQVNLNFIK